MGEEVREVVEGPDQRWVSLALKGFTAPGTTPEFSLRGVAALADRKHF